MAADCHVSRLHRTLLTLILLYTGIHSIKANDCNDQALGIESGAVKDDQLSVIYDAKVTDPTCARPGKTCIWCAKKEFTAYFNVDFRKTYELHAIKLLPAGDTQIEEFVIIGTEAINNRKTPLKDRRSGDWRFAGPTNRESRKIFLAPTKITSVQIRFYNNRVDPCLKFELYGCREAGVCEPKCLNDGKCTQDQDNPDRNVCDCAKGFAGNQCELSTKNVKTEEYKFAKENIETHNSVIKQGKLGETLVLNGANSYAVIANIPENSCVRDPTTCTNGLTLHMWMNLADVKNGAILLKSNGDRAKFTGIDLIYQNDKLIFSVAEKHTIHTASSELKQRDTWALIDLSFHPQSGAKIFINKKLESGASVKKTVNLQGAPKAELIFGFNKETGVELKAEIDDVKSWPASNDALVALQLNNNFPTLDQAPSVKVVVPREQGPTEFNCNVPKLRDRGFVLKVEWQLNGKPIKPSQNLPVDVEEHEKGTLYEWEIIPRLKAGDKLTCSVRACYTTVCDLDDFVSPPKFSSSFTPEIKIEYPGSLTLVEGEEGQRIRITPNLPPRFFCECDECDFDCQIRFVVEIVQQPNDLRCPDGSHVSQAVIRWDGGETDNAFCGVGINRLTYNDTQDIWIKAKLDGKCDGDQTRTWRLHQECYCGSKKISTKQIKQDTMLIKDKDRCNGNCHSNNDPHMGSFDRLNFDYHGTGEFVLYRNTKTKDQVNIYYDKCGGHYVSCNCGVAIKVDDSVIVIDRCGPHKERHNGQQHVKILLFLNGQLSPAVRLFRNGQTYQVILPSGTSIFATKSYNPFINVQVTPSAVDWESTEGLCGTFNGNQRDDFKQPNGVISNNANIFGNSWTVARQDSLFWGVCPTPRNNLQLTNADQVFCQCPTVQTPKCAVGMDKWHCANAAMGTGKDITEEMFNRGLGNRRPAQCNRLKKRRRRDTEFKDISDQPFHLIKKRQVAISPAEARTICHTQILNTPAARTCANFFKENSFDNLVKNCESDILETGDKAWALVGLDNLRQECITRADTDVSKWQADGNGQLQPAAQLTAQLCANNCNSRGTCTKGVCQCNGGFGGSDCSIDSKAIIKNLEIENAERLCQLEHGTNRCFNVRIFGKSFMNTPQAPKCLVTSGQVMADGKFQITSPLQQAVINAQIINEDSIVCAIPEHLRGSALKIEVANSGPWSLETITFLPYDIACQQCSITGCTIKKDTCYISNKCYEKFELNENNKDQMCDPSVSQLGFSRASQKYFQFISSEIGNGFIDLKLKVTQSIKTICSCGDSKKCSLNVRADLAEKDSFTKNIFTQKFLPHLVVEKSCSAEVKADTLESKLRLRILQDNLLDAGGVIKLKLWSQCNLDSGTVDRMEEILPIRKNLNNRQEQCTLIFDSQLTMFSRQTFNFNEEGEFQLYQHEDKSQEITVFRRRCLKAYSPACTCAVATRIGDDVFVFNRCGAPGEKSNLHIDLKTYINGDLMEGTRLLSHVDGSRYEVLFPSGARLLIIAAKSGFLNLFLFASTTESLDKIGGMCNPLNGLKSIKVSSSASLYSGVCPKEYPAGDVFCACRGRQNNDCARHSDTRSIYRDQTSRADVQDITANIDLLKIPIEEGKCGGGGFLITNDPSPKEPSWPTASGLTQNQASEICRRGVTENQVFKVCTRFYGLQGQAERLIESCMRAILLSDNLRVASEALELYREECRQASMRGVQQYSYDSLNHQVVVNPEVMNQLCPNDCSGYGTCQMGVCSCANRFAGADCSQRSDWEPEIVGLENGGAITTFGKVLVRSKRMAADLKPICEIKKRDANGAIIGNFEAVTTVYISTEALACHWNGIDSGIIRIRYVATNKFSTEFAFISYRPLCQACHVVLGVCQIKAGYCYIDRTCVLDGKRDATNLARYCDPRKSKFDWTEMGPDLTKCRITPKGYEYIGNQAKTANGYTCQRWDQDKPHSVFHVYKDPKVFPDATLADAANYCRNPDFSESQPWCYTTDPDRRWDFCTIPVCEDPDCWQCSQGRCKIKPGHCFIQGHCYADGKRNPKQANQVCKAGVSITEWITTKDFSKCRGTIKGWEYTGTKSTTVNGFTCQKWSEDFPHKVFNVYKDAKVFPDTTLADASNYCRNPDFSEKQPWCYTTDPNKRWDYCNVPMCYPDITKCKTTEKGWEYIGDQSKTLNGYTCQRWDVDTPHSVFNLYKDPKVFPDQKLADAANYCRNPDHSEAQPWCYTTDPKRRWDYCNIPFCGPDLTSCRNTHKGWEYIGSESKTVNGFTCQRWSVDTPHKVFDGYKNAKVFPDDLIAHAENYCRNPDFSESQPWCYTTDPNKRWDFCNIPLCKPDLTKCRTSAKGWEYVGKHSTTANGFTCQRWSVDTPHKVFDGYKAAKVYPDATLEDAGNYCRNPDHSESQPWCYTTDPNRRWDFCNIPMCYT